MGLQMIVISSSALAMLGLVNREGVVTTAAYGVTQQLWTYVQMPAMALGAAVSAMRSEEHTSELQSLMRISYAVFCMTKKKNTTTYPATKKSSAQDHLYTSMHTYLI